MAYPMAWWGSQRVLACAGIAGLTCWLAAPAGGENPPAAPPGEHRAGQLDANKASKANEEEAYRRGFLDGFRARAAIDLRDWSPGHRAGQLWGDPPLSQSPYWRYGRRGYEPYWYDRDRWRGWRRPRSWQDRNEHGDHWRAAPWSGQRQGYGPGQGLIGTDRLPTSQ